MDISTSAELDANADLDRVVEAVASGERLVSVVGGPGTGKTSCLRRAVSRSVQDGIPLERIAILTHSRPAAQRLRREIIADLGTTHLSTTITTVHGWCQRLLAELLPTEKLPRLLTAPEQDARLRELLAKTPVTQWPQDLAGALGTQGFIQQLRVFLARTRQLGMGPVELAELGSSCGVAEWVAAAQFFAEYLAIGEAENVIDYAELVHRTRLEVAKSGQGAAVARAYDLIVVDELAEMDPSMINLIAELHHAGPRVLAFADPTTSVFDFRGTDPRAVSTFSDRFEVPGEETRTFVFSKNLRCDPDIAAGLSGVSRRLPARGPVPEQNYEAPVGNQVRVPKCADQAEVLSEVARTLLTAHLIDDTPWRQMAVVTRAGHSAVSELARRLSRLGVPVQIHGDDLALGQELAVKQLVALVTAAADIAETGQLTDRQASSLLCSPLGGCDRVQLAKFTRRLRGLVIGAGEQPEPGLLAQELVAPRWADDDSWKQIVSLRNKLEKLSSLIKADKSVSVLLWEAWNTNDWPASLKRRALAGDNESARANLDLDAVIALFDLAEKDTKSKGATGLRQFIAELSAQQIAADTARESDRRANAVTVATVHRVKGEEFDVVAVVGAQEGAWPRTNPPSGLLRTSELLSARDEGFVTPARAVSMTDHLAAERRAFLLAASRARRLLLVPVCDAADDVGGPSRFVPDLGVVYSTPSQVSMPVTLEELVAELRRTVTVPPDPELAAHAGELLWELAAEADHGRRKVPGAATGDWWDLRELSRSEVPINKPGNPVRLSPSSVESLLACPRAWFLDRKAGGAPAASDSVTMGRIIHELAERSANSGIPAAEILAANPELVDGLEGPAWLRAGVIQKITTAAMNFDDWVGDPDSRNLVAVEAKFNVELEIEGESVIIAGQADRVELDGDGKLRVIDFKTGSQAFIQADVDVMDQLGIYQLVALKGAFEDYPNGVRECSGAETVHLRASNAARATVRRQAPISDDPSWVLADLAAAAAIIRSENFEARASSKCKRCPHRIGCPIQEAQA